MHDYNSLFVVEKSNAELSGALLCSTRHCRAEGAATTSLQDCVEQGGTQFLVKRLVG